MKRIEVIMEKFGVFLIVISTLITIALYIWFFIDIIDEASKKNIDRCSVYRSFFGFVHVYMDFLF